MFARRYGTFITVPILDTQYNTISDIREATIPVSSIIGVHGPTPGAEKRDDVCMLYYISNGKEERIPFRIEAYAQLLKCLEAASCTEVKPVVVDEENESDT